jgi:hypothetical protein
LVLIGVALLCFASFLLELYPSYELGKESTSEKRLEFFPDKRVGLEQTFGDSGEQFYLLLFS